MLNGLPIIRIRLKICPNGRKLLFSHPSNRTDSYGFAHTFKVYQCEDCSDCPFRSLCTKAKEGNNRKLYVNEKWEQQKASIREKLSEGKTENRCRASFRIPEGSFAFHSFLRKRKRKDEKGMGFSLLAVNLRKYTARNNNQAKENQKTRQKGVRSSVFDERTPFHLISWLVLSRPLPCAMLLLKK